MFPFLDDLLHDHPHSSRVLSVSIHEGEAACCAEPVELLTQILSKKYALLLMYVSYGDQLREMFRDGVYAHFQEHIEEERQSIYAINKKLTALGEDGSAHHEEIPCVRLDDARDVFSNIQREEEACVCLWSKLFHATEDDVALNGMAQEGAQLDQTHADDMKRYLRSHR